MAFCRCNETCREFEFGADCGRNCSCNKTNTEECNRETGACVCKPGWTKESGCHTVCGNNTYGKDCDKKCNCRKGQLCNPLTGCSCRPGLKGNG